MLWLVILIGITGGMAAALQGPLTTLISQRLGLWEAVFIVHLGGAVAVTPLLLARGGGQLNRWRELPPYALSAGALGLVVLWAITYGIVKVGVATTITFFVAGQLLLGLLLDHQGWLVDSTRPINLARLVGLVLVFGGVWLFLRPSR